jgi:hypothetical protein
VIHEHPAARTAARLALRPVPYVVVVIFCMAAAFAFRLRTEGIFACPATGYETATYLAYCQATGYGDYDRGALWYGLEPEAQRAAAQAEVLFLGSSRMQLAFSTPATAEWFESASAPFYLLGFTHTEDMMFIGPLLQKLAARPEAYVINVDQFFDDRVTEPAKAILEGGDGRLRYHQKRLWQDAHQVLCTTIEVLCADSPAFYRERRHGTWQLRGSVGLPASGVADGPPQGEEHWRRFAALAERFIAALPVQRQCVVLTIAPYKNTRRAEAEAIAAALGLPLISPQLEDLRTFDGSHLDPPSAERWSRAFYQAAGPRLRQCLQNAGGPGASPASDGPLTAAAS